MSWVNTSWEDFNNLLHDSELIETPVPVEVFLHDRKYMGVKSVSTLQQQIIEVMSQIFLPHTLIDLYGEEKGKQIWEQETVNELVILAGKGGGKDWTNRMSFAYAIYKLHCLKNPLEYYGKSNGTYIDLLNIAVNADQARNVFFDPLRNIMKLSPWFQSVGFEIRKSEIEFKERPIRLFSGNSEAESWEGLDLLLVVLDEIAAFKAIKNTTPVLTTNGWIKNGDLRVGDCVIGQNGKPTEVLGVYPQGEREVFQVSFEDGTTAECSEDHVWNVREYSDGRRKSVKNLSLKDFKSITLKGKYNQKRYAIPIVDPVEFIPSKNLPIDPYILGILISEGSLTNGAVRFAATEQFIVDEIDKRLDFKKLSIKGPDRNQYRIICERYSTDSYRRWHPYIIALEELGLWNKKAGDKFIPDIYLYSSIADRKQLLAGLMDGDGTYARGHGSYTTISDRLKDDFLELCRGLGGVPTASQHKSWRKNEKNERIYDSDKWMICPRLSFNPFLLPRKAARWKPHNRTLWRSIVGVKSLNYKEDMTCIKISNDDGLYVIKDYILTHNTDSELKGENKNRLSASALYKMSKLSVISRFPSVGKVSLISFPRHRKDFIMQRYAESAREEGVFRLRATTWELNPLITREMLEPEFKRNPVDSESRFGVNPPEALGAYFRDPQRVRSCFKGTPYTGENGEVLLREDLDLFPVDENGRFKDWFKAIDGYPRFVHVDLAKGVRDRAALCMTHSPGTRKVLVSNDTYENLPVIKMDLIKYWDAIPGQEIDFADIRQFIILLSKRFPLGLVTFDQWSSTEFIQNLNKRGINADNHSVKLNDYDNLSTCFYDGRFRGYFNKLLVEDEILELILVNGKKVEHQTGGHDDGSQALAGSVAMTCLHMDLDQELEIDILGLDDDWNEYETQDALDDDLMLDGRRQRRTNLYSEDFEEERKEDSDTADTEFSFRTI